MEQEKVIKQLEAYRFLWQYYLPEHKMAVLIRYLGSLTQRVEVTADGLCNGKTIEEYLNL